MPLKKVDNEQGKSNKYLYIGRESRVVVRFVGVQEVLYQYFRKPVSSENMMQMSAVFAMASLFSSRHLRQV